MTQTRGLVTYLTLFENGTFYLFLDFHNLLHPNYIGSKCLLSDVSLTYIHHSSIKIVLVTGGGGDGVVAHVIFSVSSSPFGLDFALGLDN